MDRWTPATDASLEPVGLGRLPPAQRPDAELLRFILALASMPSRALVRCVVAVAEARSVVIEHNYFDIDFRSEYSVAHAGSFATTLPPHTRRLHFFSAVIPDDDPVMAPPSWLQHHYLGYLILRPFGPGAVGRTLLSPPTSHFHADPRFRYRIRAMVQEDVHLFGHPLQARGVPFMEQDGRLLTCAHVASWICHFSAVLRGLVPRRPTAAFFQAGAQSGDGRRRYPSPGLTANAVVEVLNRFDLPPDIQYLSSFNQEGTIRTFHRKRDGKPPMTKDDWWRWNLTAEICRYLNGGVPVAFATSDHVVVMCGYLRQRHMTEDAVLLRFPADLTDNSLYVSWRDERPTPPPEDDDVVAFIVQDDQRGPYCLLSVQQMLQLAQPDSGASLSCVITPHPHGLWLSGNHAELAGWGYLETTLSQLLLDEGARLTAAFSDDEDGAAADVVQDIRTKLASFRRSLMKQALAVRSYPTTADDFKLSFAARCRDPVAREAVRKARLPKFIWVVEALARGHRRNKPVVAEVVLDASTPGRRPHALIVQLPHLIIVSEPSWGDTVMYAPCQVTKLDSGRWAEGKWPSASTGSKAKGAITGWRLI